jgi:hypothetical protein
MMPGRSLFSYLIAAIFSASAVDAQVTDTQQPSPISVAASSCEKLREKTERETCWRVNPGFACDLLADAVEEADCIVDHSLVQITDPGKGTPSGLVLPPPKPGLAAQVPDGVKVYVPPPDNVLMHGVPDMLPMQGYAPGEVKG